MEYEINVEDQKVVVLENESKYEVDLRTRLFIFSKNTIKILMIIPHKKEFDVFRSQLSRSATSIGANYEESQACSYAEFRQRIQICLREARETHYWLRLLRDIIVENQQDINIGPLVDEISEIKRIFGAISSKVKK